ncbi:MAG: heavy metal response regulator transcription factor [Legionellaceae bacterium]|nr:heavy metal response regulator transcription factor [Legionellaceae bacterium]
MNILVVDDKKSTADFICKGLSEYQFLADKAYDGAEALFMMQEKSYDLVILDVILPVIDGWTVLQKVRAQDVITPILMLSACDDVESRVKGLELGADDYLIKPFSFHELVARIKSLLRRKPVVHKSVKTIADLEIDHEKYTVFRAGKKLSLSSKEFKLLSFLMRNESEVLTRTVIAEHVWDINFECNTNVIDVAIRRLREKIDDNFKTKLIHTIRGVGYILEVR